MQPIDAEAYCIAPSPLIRVAGPEDAPFVSELCGWDVREAMTRVVTLVSDHGFFFLEPITSSIWEGHMNFAPEGRGKEALHAMKAGLRYAFEGLGAAVVFGRVPIENHAARMLTRLAGMKSDGVRPREHDGPLVEWFEIRSDTCLPH